MSSGAILFSFGSRRFMASEASLMIHDVTGGAHGKSDHVVATAEEQKRRSDLIYHMMAEQLGKHRTYFLDMMHDKDHTDIYMTADECLKYNIATDIGVPKLNINIKVDYELEF